MPEVHGLCLQSLFMDPVQRVSACRGCFPASCACTRHRVLPLVLQSLPALHAPGISPPIAAVTRRQGSMASS